MDTIQDIRAFDQWILDVVQDYIEKQDCYASDAVLAIDSKNFTVYVESTKNLTADAEKYQLAELIRQDEKGCTEPDCDATNVIACKYFFVR
ncbi:MAG: hypothetical protein IKW86_10610 [Salinivirgaceae bacterium]|nr:hypothetical protein [Salinivirgaceae bacterium]